MADGLNMWLDRKEVTNFIKDANRRGANLRSFFGACAAILHTSAMLTFKAGGRPTRWKPLSPWTEAVRKAGKQFGGHGLSQNTLMASGRLRGSIGSVRQITNSSLTFGTNLKYAALQQFGGTVVPKSGKYLALPFPGVKGRPRQQKNAFFRHSRKGNLILFGQTTLKSVPISNVATQKTTRRRIKPIRGITPLFLMLKSVTVPSRLFLLFQQQDVNQISVLALAFHFDPSGYDRMAAQTALGRTT